MPRKAKSIPSYLHHKASNKAKVRIKGRDYYLGEYDSDKSRVAYARILGWLNFTDEPPEDWQDRLPGTAEADNQHVGGITIVEIIARFLRHCQDYYADSNEDRHIGYALAPVRELYDRLPASEFGPMKLQNVRQRMVDDGLTRSGINKRIHRIRRMFKWAVSQELIPAGIYEGLKSVDGLKQGRTKAKENAPVGPVSDSDVDAVKDEVTPQIWTMIELQRLTGMRPGEVTKMKTKDIDRTGATWIYKPALHKNRYRGHDREIYLGPLAQELLKPWLRAKQDEYLFSPAESIESYRQQQSEERTTPLSCGNRRGTNRVSKPTRKPTEYYEVKAYARAIKRACKRVGIPQWTPHKLRHSAATRLRKEFGLEAARTILGHRHVSATEIYAEVNRDQAIEVMQQVG